MSAFLFINYGEKAFGGPPPVEGYYYAKETAPFRTKEMPESQIYVHGEYIPFKPDYGSDYYITKDIKPPQNQPGKTVAIFSFPMGRMGQRGGWVLEPDYRHVDLWDKRFGTCFNAVGRKDHPAIYGGWFLYPYRLWNKDDPYYPRVGKLPHFLTTKEPQEGQRWDYSIEDWSYDPVQPEPISLSKYQLPPELDKFLEEQIRLISGSTDAITTNAKEIDDLKVEIDAVQPKIETLQELFSLRDDPIFPNNLLKVLNEGTVFLSEFIETKNKKRYKYLLDDGVYADTAAFFIDGDIRENLRIFIGSEDGRCKLSFSKKQFDSLNKKMLINLSDAFVEWKTFE